MRVLCCSTPMESVFAFFVPLGRGLLQAGHEVVVATGVDLQDRVAREGFAPAVAGPTAIEAAMAAFADPAVVNAPDGEDWHFAAAMFGAVIAPAKMTALRKLADSYRPDLIVHPPVDLAGPLLAAERNLPSVAYGFGQLPEPRLVAALARRVATLWEQAGLVPDPYAGIYRGLFLDPRPPSLQAADPTDAVLQAIRPEVPGDAAVALPPWAGSLGQRPVVYLSLGTIPLFNQAEKFEMLLGDLGHEDLDVIVTIGDLNDPASLGPQPPNVHVERWLPLASVLPRCDAVVCHAGSGTTLAALARGLPLVLVPQGADHFANAAACQRAGVARVLNPGTVSSAAVRDATVALLEPNGLEQQAARRVAAEIAAMPDASEVARRLDVLVGR